MIIATAVKNNHRVLFPELVVLSGWKMDMDDGGTNGRAAIQDTNMEYGDSGDGCIDSHNQSSMELAVPTGGTTTTAKPTEDMASYLDNYKFMKSNVISEEFGSVKDAEDF